MFVVLVNQPLKEDANASEIMLIPLFVQKEMCY